MDIHINKNVLGFKDKIAVKFRSYDKNLPWRLWKGTAGSREAVALCKKNFQYLNLLFGYVEENSL